MNDIDTTKITFAKMHKLSSWDTPQYAVSYGGYLVGWTYKDDDGDWAAICPAGTVAWDNTRSSATLELIKVWREYTTDSPARFEQWAILTRAHIRGQRSGSLNEMTRELRSDYRRGVCANSFARYIDLALGYTERGINHDGIRADVEAHLRTALALVECDSAK